MTKLGDFNVVKLFVSGYQAPTYGGYPTPSYGGYQQGGNWFKQPTIIIENSKKNKGTTINYLRFRPFWPTFHVPTEINLFSEKKQIVVVLELLNSAIENFHMVSTLVLLRPKVIIEKSRGEVSLVEQDTFENVS